MPQEHNTPSLYEMLTGNFTGGLDLHQVSEQNQVILSVGHAGAFAGLRSAGHD